jgi:hypothetical protein
MLQLKGIHESNGFPASRYALNPGTRTFWMTPKLSDIVIIILIAKLALLYHKRKNTWISH